MSRGGKIANAEHLSKLNEGIEAWNKWREENPKIEPDLGGANFAGANLENVNLENANLAGANLARAYLPWVNLKHVCLEEAHLEGAHLWGSTSKTPFSSGRTSKGLSYAMPASTMPFSPKLTSNMPT